jgi:hypothetical protein
VHLRYGLLIASLVTTLGACAGCGEETVDDGSGGGGSGGSGGSGGGIVTPPISAKHAVKFKTKGRLLKDFSAALALPTDQLCQELGQYNCADVHAIALGGVDAYGAGVYEPLKASAITTPLAVDRLALSGCTQRAVLDFKDLDAAKIFKLEVENGALVDINAESTSAVITTLFQRIHLRDPKDNEAAHLRDLYPQLIEAGSTTPARDWASLSCYSVLTMMESLFY